VAPLDARRALSEALYLCGRLPLHHGAALRPLLLALLAPLGGAVPVAFESVPADETLPAETAARLALAMREGAVGPECLDGVRHHVDRLVGEERAAVVLRDPPLVELADRLPGELRALVRPLAWWASAPVPAVASAAQVHQQGIAERELLLLGGSDASVECAIVALVESLHTATVLSLTTASARAAERDRQGAALAHNESRARASSLAEAVPT